MPRLIALLAFTMLASTSMAQVATSNGTGVTLRALDKLTGKVSQLQVAAGHSTEVGRITIFANECRYPNGNAAGEAYASLTITEIGKDAPIYQGWMIASSPALNPMEHQRYDVWVLRCTTS
ncbi:DUF2155 domain-containing protein [Marivita sp. XM-24bin2]|jgi:hypothetical protein|uniref:DUF2155 domain-containing protein n=1 Tax=unclassified Marivita TaxID=2632480 RepID=UPI000D78DEDB|nr:DUF2155 domain-containing protein [Marivita sp. XM-24bin2]MCR9109413.1 DUF2155 domain-containing protein [Paracoccaceae bacterium]PWL35417.1 MAG: DUF2155 domain-containing protein [Marivita sp. XM-24bin2]